MGVDCRVSLPGNVRVRNVAKVMGAIMGLPVMREPLGHNYDKATCAEVYGFTVNTTSIPEMVELSFQSRHFFVDGEKSHTAYFHFEGDEDRPMSRGINPRSTAFWIAVMQRVVMFFGGEMDYQDCDESTNDFVVAAKGPKMNCPEDGEPWQNLQDRILAIKPLTDEEWRKCDQFAAYKIKE